MNKFDLIILIPIIWGCIVGFRKGLILEIASLAGLVLGIWGALKFSSLTAKYLSDWMDASPSLISLLSFVLTFILIVVAIYLLAKVLDKTLKMAAMGMLIRISGALFGLIKYALVLSVLFYLFEAINSKWEIIDPKEYEESYSYKILSTINQPVYDWLDQLELEFDSGPVEEIL